MPEKGQQHTV